MTWTDETPKIYHEFGWWFSWNLEGRGIMMIPIVFLRSGQIIAAKPPVGPPFDGGLGSGLPLKIPSGLGIMVICPEKSYLAHLKQNILTSHNRKRPHHEPTCASMGPISRQPKDTQLPQLTLPDARLHAVRQEWLCCILDPFEQWPVDPGYLLYIGDYNYTTQPIWVLQ